MQFRVFDKQEEEMSEVFDVFHSADGEVKFPSGEYSYDYIGFHSERFIIMQSTGLKDREGKEIFEGDVIEVPYDEGHTRNAIMKCYEIEEGRDANIFTFDLDESVTYTLIDLDCEIGEHNIEVLGDVHCNPELLKAEK